MKGSSLGAPVICPITGKILSDPWVDGEGNIYDGPTILEWIDRFGVSPITGRPMTRADVRPSTTIVPSAPQAKAKSSSTGGKIYEDTDTPRKKLLNVMKYTMKMVKGSTGTSSKGPDYDAILRLRAQQLAQSGGGVAGNNASSLVPSHAVPHGTQVIRPTPPPGPGVGFSGGKTTSSSSSSSSSSSAWADTHDILRVTSVTPTVHNPRPGGGLPPLPPTYTGTAGSRREPPIVDDSYAEIALGTGGEESSEGGDGDGDGDSAARGGMRKKKNKKKKGDEEGGGGEGEKKAKKKDKEKKMQTKDGGGRDKVSTSSQGSAEETKAKKKKTTTTTKKKSVTMTAGVDISSASVSASSSAPMQVAFTAEALAHHASGKPPRPLPSTSSSSSSPSPSHQSQQPHSGSRLRRLSDGRSVSTESKSIRSRLSSSSRGTRLVDEDEVNFYFGLGGSGAGTSISTIEEGEDEDNDDDSDDGDDKGLDDEITYEHFGIFSGMCHFCCPCVTVLSRAWNPMNTCAELLFRDNGDSSRNVAVSRAANSVDAMLALALFWALNSSLCSVYALRVSGFREWLDDDGYGVLSLLISSSKSNASAVVIMLALGYCVPRKLVSSVTIEASRTYPHKVTDTFVLGAAPFLVSAFAGVAPMLWLVIGVAVWVGLRSGVDSYNWQLFYSACSDNWWTNLVFVTNFSVLWTSSDAWSDVTAWMDDGYLVDDTASAGSGTWSLDYVDLGSCIPTFWLVSCAAQLIFVSLPVMYFYLAYPRAAISLCYALAVLCVIVRFIVASHVHSATVFAAYVQFSPWGVADAYFLGMVLFMKLHEQVVARATGVAASSRMPTGLCELILVSLFSTSSSSSPSYRTAQGGGGGGGRRSYGAADRRYLREAEDGVEETEHLLSKTKSTRIPVTGSKVLDKKNKKKKGNRVLQSSASAVAAAAVGGGGQMASEFNKTATKKPVKKFRGKSGDEEDDDDDDVDDDADRRTSTSSMLSRGSNSTSTSVFSTLSKGSYVFPSNISYMAREWEEDENDSDPLGSSGFIGTTSSSSSSNSGPGGSGSGSASRGRTAGLVGARAIVNSFGVIWEVAYSMVVFILCLTWLLYSSSLSSSDPPEWFPWTEWTFRAITMLCLSLSSFMILNLALHNHVWPLTSFMSAAFWHPFVQIALCMYLTQYVTVSFVCEYLYTASGVSGVDDGDAGVAWSSGRQAGFLEYLRNYGLLWVINVGVAVLLHIALEAPLGKLIGFDSILAGAREGRKKVDV